LSPSATWNTSKLQVLSQAANTLQLFTLVNADLKSFHPKPDSTTPGSSFDPLASVEPRFPKSLYLIQPLFSAYELNPVAPNAQGNVPIPEGLDLDAWIIPPPQDPVTLEDANEPEERRTKRSKKGKGKEVNGKPKSGKHKRQEVVDNTVSASAPSDLQPEVDTAEDRAETERVCHSLQVNLYKADDLGQIAQGRTTGTYA
jgi:AP-3 complex subunit delta